MNTIIGLCGQLGSGKDTAATLLRDKFNYRHLAFASHIKVFGERVFQFDKQQLWGPSEFRNKVDDRSRESSYWEACENRLALYGPDWVSRVVPDSAPLLYHSLFKWFEQLQHDYFNNLSPRIMLQSLGTDWGRLCVDDNVWRDAVLKEAIDNPRSVVISDVRFENEIEGIQRAGGKVIRIVRESTDQWASSTGIQGHISEAAQQSLPDHLFDAIINNSGSLEEFEETVIETVRILTL